LSGGGFREYLAIVGDRQRQVRVEPDGENLRIRVDGEEFSVGCSEGGTGEFCLFLNGRPQVVNVLPEGEGRYRVMLGGGETTVSVTDPVAARLGGVNRAIRQDKRIEVRAPMHGLVVAVQVKEGDHVEEESPLVVLEAMKMQNALTSPAAGIVRHVHARPGETVEGDALLVVLDRKDSHEPDA
jgi:biotin carboxyl carrier protein